MESTKSKKKRKNKLFYTLTMIIIIIIFCVIFLSGDYLQNIFFVDKLPKQPVNNIKGIDIIDNKEDNDGKIFVYTEDKVFGNYIYLINQFPTADKIGRELEGAYKTFDFKLEFSKKSVGVNYEIVLEKLPESDLDDSWVKVYLENEGIPTNNTLRKNGKVKTFNEYAKYNEKNNEIMLLKGTVSQKEAERGYKSFRLRMWISEDVKIVNDVYESKTIIARVNVHANGNI